MKALPIQTPCRPRQACQGSTAAPAYCHASNTARLVRPKYWDQFRSISAWPFFIRTCCLCQPNAKDPNASCITRTLLQILSFIMSIALVFLHVKGPSPGLCFACFKTPHTRHVQTLLPSSHPHVQYPMHQEAPCLLCKPSLSSNQPTCREPCLHLHGRNASAPTSTSLDASYSSSFPRPVMSHVCTPI